jgi:hypothetical protein
MCVKTQHIQRQTHPQHVCGHSAYTAANTSTACVWTLSIYSIFSSTSSPSFITNNKNKHSISLKQLKGKALPLTDLGEPLGFQEVQAHRMFIPFNFSTPSLHWSSPHFTSLHYTTLHFTSLHFDTLHFTSHHHTSLHFTSLYFTSLHFDTLHFTFTRFSPHVYYLHFTPFIIAFLTLLFL